MPLSTHAPIKLLYVVAFAFQIELTSDTSVEASKAGRRPKLELKGILLEDKDIRAGGHHGRTFGKVDTRRSY